MLAQDELKIMCTGDLPLHVNYAAGRLMAVIVVLGCSLNLLVKVFNAGWLIILL